MKADQSSVTVSPAAGTTTVVSGPLHSLQRVSQFSGYVDAGRRAMTSNPPNYGFIAEAALGMAGVLTENKKVELAGRIVGVANRLKYAWDNRNADPAALLEAAIGVAEVIATIKYDAEHPEQKDANGNVILDMSLEAVTNRYQRAARVVRAAGENSRSAL